MSDATELLARLQSSSRNVAASNAQLLAMLAMLLGLPGDGLKRQLFCS